MTTSQPSPAVQTAGFLLLVAAMLFCAA